ncbi:MAG: type VI secretion system protein ImpC [Planctomycetota bacterium]|jgi:type VI secretion system protein ImpC
MVNSRPEVSLSVGMQGQPQAQPHEPAAASDPFKILVVADLSGRASRGECAPDTIAQRRVTRIDRDDFEDVLAAMTPTLHVPFGASGASLEMTFKELDDFHPDALYQRVDVFDRLRSLRDRLNNPKTAAAAIEELTSARQQPEAKPEQPEQPDADSTDASGIDASSLLESALQATESAPASSRSSSIVDQLVREFVTPHSIPRPDARVADLVADVERAMSGEMRALLTSAPFQQLEASWRSLYLLVRRLDTDSKLQIHVLDVSAEELRAGFASADDPLRTGLAKHLIDRAGDTAGGVPYAVVVTDFSAAASIEDVALVEQLAAVSARAGSVTLCAASSQLVGCDSFSVGPDTDDWQSSIDAAVQQQWSTFRARPEAAAMGMIMPRVLTRQPYGAKSSPVSCFPFEEERGHESGDYRHDDLPWGNAAFLVALLLGETFQRDGWRMQLLASDEVSGMPLYVRTVAGQSEAVPCAEVELSSGGGERIGERGIMSMYSVLGTDSVRLGVLRSVSSVSVGLSGRWG